MIKKEIKELKEYKLNNVKKVLVLFNFETIPFFFSLLKSKLKLFIANSATKQVLFLKSTKNLSSSR